jgi:hypothetical protein
MLKLMHKVRGNYRSCGGAQENGKMSSKPDETEYGQNK